MASTLSARSLRIASMIAAALLAPCAVAGAPIVPGLEHLQRSGGVDSSTLGEILLNELNCASCHAAAPAAGQRIAARRAPDLSGAGSRITPRYLRAFLADPHGVKPGTTMPDLLRHMDSGARDRAVEALTHFIVSRGGPMEASRAEVSEVRIERGRELYHTAGCAACHGAEQGSGGAVDPVPVGDMAGKTTVEQMAVFLQDPLKTRPAGRMPSLHLTDEEADALAHYLLRGQADHARDKSAEPTIRPGLDFVYYEGDFSVLPEFDELEGRGSGRVGTFHISDLPVQRANDRFAIEFTGILRIPRDGMYEFFTASDDGTKLFLDGVLVVDNDGVHARQEQSGEIELEAGDHRVRVEYFEGGGEEWLEVRWRGPGLEKQSISEDVLFHEAARPMVPVGMEEFVLDADLAERGRHLFATVGCASCHEMPGVESTLSVEPLASLDLDNPAGCVTDRPPAGVPDYNLSDDQREMIRATLESFDGLSEPRGPEHQVVHTLAAFNCYACHNRDGVGGPRGDRRDLFLMSGEFDLGDEGRIPPPLTGVGAKLRPSALEESLFEGDLHVRPYMATRMPQFGRDTLTGLIDALKEADGPPDDAGAPHFSADAVKDGRKLVGITGLGCVNCHTVAGRESLGIPAVDLANVHERVRYEWFRRFVADPTEFSEETRMPSFWLDGEAVRPDIAGGDAGRQIDAIWAYLSLGKTMPLPEGLKKRNDELMPIDQPIVFRTFMEEVGPRAIAVGYPEMVHVAFDANKVRLARAWRGKFFDASGTWSGRAGQFHGPLGTDIIDMPPGPAFAMARSGESWPQMEKTERAANSRFLGYRLDDQNRPIFHYETWGWRVEEQPIPVLREGGAALVRQFDLKSRGLPITPIQFLAASGSKIERRGENTWRIDDRLTVRMKSERDMGPRVHEIDGTAELRLSIPNAETSFEVELSW